MPTAVAVRGAFQHGVGAALESTAPSAHVVTLIVKESLRIAEFIIFGSRATEGVDVTQARSQSIWLGWHRHHPVSLSTLATAPNFGA